ncbi:MAG: group II intron reverse transcriptase/maturase [Deltaproteobacteria bacterium]|nr:group II intron reverse transcriptase/maturase [Deltaproteobacteria bacterium]
MGLKTPENIRNLQRKLYLKAKSEPDFRFYILYDKIYRKDILKHAYRMAKANGGSAGVDGVTFEMVESGGVEEWLAGIREQLHSKAYKPQPVRRVMIPKPGGGKRPLGIPTIRDRVVQTATKLVIEPIFEADLEPNAYGYRPKRSALDAIIKIHKLLLEGYTDVVDADLSKYFDTIPHTELMQCVARRIVDRNVLRLIKLWLKSPIVYEDGKGGGKKIKGGRKNNSGTPQGGVISPLLANVYMNRFLKYWRMKRCDEVFQAQVVSYADDFVILSRGQAAEALEWTDKVMNRLGLRLNEDKTSIRDGLRGNFDFLGYTFGHMVFKKDGSWYTGASPSKVSVSRLRQKVKTLLRPCEKGAWPDVRDRLNALLRGWSTYFCYGTTMIAYRAVERNVYNRVRRFLVERHKVRSRGIHRFPSERVFGELGVILPRPIKPAGLRVP